MLNRTQYGWDGFYYADGLFQTVSLTEITTSEGTTVQKGYVNASLADGTPIDPDKIYTGVTLKFLLEGGDDFIKVFGDYVDPETGNSYVPIVAKNVQDVGEQREELYAQLNKLGTITKEDWYPNPQMPRMVVIQN